MKYDVFISYSSHDQKVVEGLCAYLEQHKIRCFVAYRDIPRGVVWARAIVDALDESRMMVVVFSENFNNSDQVDREIELASEDKKPILTFRISNDVFKGAKKYYLKNLNWIDAFPEPHKLFDSVAENVAKLLGIEEVASKKVPTKQVQPLVVKKRYKVGDLYDDGKKQGVVFDVWDNGKHGKIVSLDETLELWCTKEQYGKGIVVGTSSKSDGKANTDLVMARADSAEYPPFQWCRAKGAEWYLPAIDELRRLLLNDEVRNAVNKTLDQHGAVKLGKKSVTECYWSSSEYVGKNQFRAWYVSMNYGGNSYYKDYYYSVRAVSAF
jgi:hypothetical protein